MCERTEVRVSGVAGVAPRLKRECAGVSDHRAVVDAVALVGGEHSRAALRRHHSHHLLQALVA